LILIGVVLIVRHRVIDPTHALWVGVALQMLLVLRRGQLALAAVRRYRGERRGGGDAAGALRYSLVEILPCRLPPSIVRALALDLRLWSSLARWIRRVPPPPGFAYHRRSRALLVAVMATVAAPSLLLLGHAFLPGALVWLRWVLDGVGAYAVANLWKLAAAQQMSPHEIEDQGLRLRYSSLLDLRVPYELIARAEYAERTRGRFRPRGLEVAPDERAAYIRVGGAVNVRLTLSRPVRLPGRGHTMPVESISLWTDTPGPLLRALEERICPAPAGGGLSLGRGVR
jgi:hypothetical protein